MTAAAPGNSNSSQGLRQAAARHLQQPAKLHHGFPEAGRGGEREAEGLGTRDQDKYQEAEIRWWRDGVPVTEGETEVKRDEDGEQTQEAREVKKIQ